MAGGFGVVAHAILAEVGGEAALRRIPQPGGEITADAGGLSAMDRGRARVAQGGAAAAAEAAARWYRLAMRLARCPARLAPPRRERHATELQAIADQLCTEPGRDWNFARLAENVGLGHEAFRKAFTRRYRMPPQAFLQRERIHRACALLWYGPQVQEVAEAVGFSDPFHFSRVFKRSLGQSPRAFLAIMRTGQR